MVKGWATTTSSEKLTTSVSKMAGKTWKTSVSICATTSRSAERMLAE